MQVSDSSFELTIIEGYLLGRLLEGSKSQYLDLN